jgi:putative methyltransferase (TIGR04325 family)
MTAQSFLKKVFDQIYLVVYCPGWSGNYENWQDALKDSTSYDNREIFNKVKESSLKVKKGQVVFERDSVVFHKAEYNWSLLAYLLWIAAQNDKQLSVVDYGGSLGSVYYQHRKFLSVIKKLRWNIVEQKQFVNLGQKHFQDETLKFYPDINSCLTHHSPDVLLISGTIQYLAEPFIFLNQLKRYNFKYIIIDLTGFFINKSEKSRITIQKVPPNIYQASYPCWIFNEQELLNSIPTKYQLIYSGNSYLGENLSVDNNLKFNYRQYLFKAK